MAFSFGYTPSYRSRQRYYAHPLYPFFSPTSLPRWFNDYEDEEDAQQYSPLYQLMQLMEGTSPAQREDKPKKKPEWHQVLDMHQYDEDDVKVTVDGQAVIINAKHENVDGENSDTIQMRRRFDADQDVDLSKLKTKFWKGHLIVTAPNKEKAEHREVALECTEEAKSKAPAESQEKTICTADPKDFKLRMKLDAFNPEDIKIKTDGKSVTISAQKEDKSDDHYSKMSFYRSFSLPENVDGEHLKSRFDANGELCITVAEPEKMIEG